MNLVIQLYTSYSDQLYLALPMETANIALQTAKVTCVSYIEKEMCKMRLPSILTPKVMSKIMDGICVKITNDLNAAMVVMGYPEVIGVLNWSTMESFELELTSNPARVQPPSTEVH